MIGHNIKRIREKRGYTQEQLAVKLSVSNRTISSWEVERTEPSWIMLQKIADVLNCQQSDLIGEPSILTTEEFNVLNAYRSSNEIIKQAICDMLHVDRYLESDQLRKRA